MATLNLSQQSVDFDTLVQQLQVHLATKESWRGFLATQTGETLLEFIAAVGALTQGKLLRYHQDAFPFTALSDEAVYALAAMQGVRLNRKVPMSIDATLYSTAGQVSIREYTQFEINGRKFFNRTAVTIDTFDTVIPLYEGTIVTYTTKGLGTDYQIFQSKETSFEVSDIDVRASLNGEVITKTLGGVWRLRNQPGYRDRTLPNGRMQLEFGNDQFGSKPTLNDILEVTYATTAGLGASSVKVIDKKVKAVDFPSIAGRANSNPSGGADERDPELYKNIAAPAFGTFESAVTKQQYLNIVQSYPGVLDGVTFAQREVNPNALEWMNLIKVVLLTASPWSETEKTTFLNYLQNSSMYTGRFFLEDPLPTPVSVVVDIFCYPSSNPEQCELDASAAITDLFAGRPGRLGFDVYRSDIIDRILESNPGIEYAILKSPSSDLIVSGRAMPRPTLSLEPVASGGVPAGSYLYSVSPSYNPGGDVPPLNYATIDVATSGTHKILVSWELQGVAQVYNVWGRLPNQLGLVASVSGTTTSFLDDATSSIVVGTPLISTVPVRYLLLTGSPTVNATFSTRSANRSNRL